MKLFFLGELKQQNGVGSANRELLKCLDKICKVTYSKATTTFRRLFEILLESMKADCIIVCSFTGLNLFGIWIAKVLKKKCIYRLHGYRRFEDTFDCTVSRYDKKKSRLVEQYIFRYADKIVCPSKLSMKQLWKYEPKYRGKINYCYNSINLENIKKIVEKVNIVKKQNRIISIGGGRKQKNIYTICKAVEYLNKKYNLDLELIVIGEKSTEIEKICQFPFVIYLGILSTDEVMYELCKSKLFVQNSIYETFGIAVLEAVYAGCDILFSKNMGVKEVFLKLDKADVIEDCMNAEEIARKIKMRLEQPNNKKMKASLQENRITRKSVCIQFLETIQSIKQERNRQK